jgi:hypothetical protein
MPGETSRINGRKGGRPKGRKSAATLEREAVQRAFNQRVMEHADRLFDAQLAAAVGVTMLFKRPKGGGQAVRVTSHAEIRKFLDRHGPAGEVEQDDGTYYFLATEKPNAEAVDRLLNRGLGKPADTVDLKGEARPFGPVTFIIRQQDGSENRT